MRTIASLGTSFISSRMKFAAEVRDDHEVTRCRLVGLREGCKFQSVVLWSAAKSRNNDLVETDSSHPESVPNRLVWYLDRPHKASMRGGFPIFHARSRSLTVRAAQTHQRLQLARTNGRLRHCLSSSLRNIMYRGRPSERDIMYRTSSVLRSTTAQTYSI